MRILFLVSSMEGGGAERVAALLSNAWAGIGHEVVLMPTFSGRGGCSYPLAPEVELRFLADALATPFARNSLGRLLALRREVRAIAPDVVVSFLTNVNVAAILARGAAPVVVSERIYPPLMPLSQRWELLRRITYSTSDCVVMQTRQGLEWLSRSIPGARGAVIGNPLQLPLPRGAPALGPEEVIPGSAKLLLSVGRLDPQKNFGLLIEAFARLGEQFAEWHLAILGEGAERGALERAITASGAAGRISLPGRSGDMGAWYGRADAFAMTSRFEGFPNALLEALGHGVPSLSLDCPSGPADLIEDGGNGILLPAEADADVVAASLGTLMARDWPELPQRSRALRERYDAGTIAEEWVALFERVIAARRRA
jgi:glycosyltransferase involved in cell wall biosynthesis